MDESDAHPKITSSRRQWSKADLDYLCCWAGTRSIRTLCRHLQRTERALRCKLHKLGLSGKVLEGWDIADLQRACHVSQRTVLRSLADGTLRLQCADVRFFPGDNQVTDPKVFAAGSQPNTALYLISDAAIQRHSSISKICADALAGHCQLIHARITEATAVRFYTRSKRLGGLAGRDKKRSDEKI